MNFNNPKLLLAFVVLTFSINISFAQTTSTGNTLGTTGVTSIQSTTDANYQLSIGGALKLFHSGNSGLSSPSLYFSNTSASGRNYFLNSDNTGSFRILDNAFATPRFTIFNSGNLGIGTSSDGGYLLDVNGTARLSLDAMINSLTVGKGIGSNNNTSTAIGVNVLGVNTTGYGNTALGYQSLFSNTEGVQNVAIGTQAMYSSTGVGGTGYQNTAVGYNALYSNTTGYTNTAIGVSSMTYNTTGFYNTAVGSSSLSRNTTGINNTALGTNAMLRNTTGNYNTAVGYTALNENLTGGSNTAIGWQALWANTADNNTAVGRDALTYNTTGINNTAVGWGALYESGTGYNNSAFGTIALQNTNLGIANTASGVAALQFNTSGNHNSALGHYAGNDLVSGQYNIFLGSNAGRGITTGSYNTILGAQVTGLSSSLSNNIIIADGQGNRRINVDANGYVGIGTTSPSAQLHTTGTVRFAGLTNDNTISRILGTDANGNVSYRDVSTLGAGGLSQWTFAGNDIYNANSGNVAVGFDVPPTFKFQVRNGGHNQMMVTGLNSGDWPAIQLQDPTAGNEFWNIENGRTTGDFDIFGQNTGQAFTIKKNSGNVGIGTTSPTAKLHVVGNSIFTNQNTFNIRNYIWGANAQTLNIGYENDAVSSRGLIDITGLGNGINGNGAVFNFHPVEGYTYNTNPNVGLLNMDVTTGFIYDFGSAIGGTYNGGGAGYRFKLSQTNTLGTNCGSYVDLQRTENVPAGYNTIGYMAKIKNSNETGIGLFLDVSNYGSYTGPSYAIYANAGKSYFANNVGINTTTPTEKLDVNGNIKLSGALMPNNTAGTAGQVLTSAGPGAAPTWTSLSGVVSSNAWGVTGNAGTDPSTNFIGTTDDKDIVVKRNNIERININSIGFNIKSQNGVNIISHNDLQEKLFVAAQVRTINNYGINVNGVMQLEAGGYVSGSNRTDTRIGSFDDWVIKYQATGEHAVAGLTAHKFTVLNPLTSAGCNVATFDNGAANLMTITKDGNIGIGTTSPTAKLHVYGTNPGLYLEGDANSYYSNITLKSVIGSGTIDNYGPLSWRSGLWTMAISANNLKSGLGATTLGNYAITLDPSLIPFNIMGAQNQSNDLLRVNKNISTTNGGVTEQNVFLINKDGKVLIGTTDATQAGSNLLAVNGSAIFTKAVVKLNATWPDYVFKKEYALPTLNQLEAYLLKNNHLPDVPSATEVDKNGIDLGDNQTILLKKVEELTLYMIELNKKVEALAKENEELKKKVKATKQ